MCLAIPGKIVELLAEDRSLAVVDVLGVRRRVDLGLLQEDPPIHRRLGAHPCRFCDEQDQRSRRAATSCACSPNSAKAKRRWKRFGGTA